MSGRPWPRQRGRPAPDGPGPSSPARPGPGIPAGHGPARSGPKQPSSPQFPRGPHSHGRDAGLGSRGARGVPGSGGAEHLTPHPPRWRPARHKPVFTPPGARLAPPVPAARSQACPAPLCQHSGHPESLPALQPRAPSCGDTPELHPGLLEPDTIPRKGSLGSGDTRARLGLAAEGNAPNIPWTPALALTRESGSRKLFFLLSPPHRFCPPRAATAELHHLQGFVAVQGDTQIPDWRSTPLPEKLGKTPPAGPVSQTLIPSPHPGKSHPHTAGCKYPCAMSLPVLQV